MGDDALLDVLPCLAMDDVVDRLVAGTVCLGDCGYPIAESVENSYFYHLPVGEKRISMAFAARGAFRVGVSRIAQAARRALGMNAKPASISTCKASPGHGVPGVFGSSAEA
jgi:hypothetical protein